VLRRRLLILAVVLASSLALSSCGGNSGGEQADSGAQVTTRTRSFVAQVPRSQPPPITVTLSLRRNGVARIVFQIADRRGYRDELGTWTEADGEVILSFEPSDHPQGALPSPLQLRWVGAELVAPAGSLGAEETQFSPKKKQG
jgi:hypothetical protein